MVWRWGQVIKQCTSLEQGRLLHLRLLEANNNNNNIERFLANLLVQMYGNLGSPGESWQTFTCTQARNIFSWNSLLRAFAHNGLLPEANWLFWRIPCTDRVTWNIMLHSQMLDVEEIRWMFDELVSERDVISWTCLITAYARNGDFDHVRRVLERMPCWDLVTCNASIQCFDLQTTRDFFLHRMAERDSATWNTVIQAVSEKGGGLGELKVLFEKMPQRNLITWTCLITALSHHGHLEDAEVLFSQMQQRTLGSWNSMLAGLGRNRRLTEAECLFDRMPGWNTVSWTILIHVYAENGDLHGAVNSFGGIPERNLVNWTALVSACVEVGDTAQARWIFERMPEHNRVTWNSMLGGYARMVHGNHVHRAEALFEQMPERDVVSWNEILQAHSSNTDSDDLRFARLAFELMPARDERSWGAMIKACVNHDHVNQAKLLFDEASETAQVRSTALGNMMILGCTQRSSSKDIFDGMKERDILSWNGLLKSTEADEMAARNVFERMPSRDVVSWAVMITALAQRSCIEEVEGLFRTMPEGDIVVWTSMITAYAENGDVKKSSLVFQRMPEWDMASVTAMVHAYARSGHIDRAREMFDGITCPDIFTWTVMISAYGQQACMEEAASLFERMGREDHLERGVITWNALLGAYADNGQPLEAFRMLGAMDLEGVTPNAATFTGLISACTEAGGEMISQGRLLHASILERGLETNTAVGNALVGFYGRCGLVGEAVTSFLDVREKDRGSWNALAAVFGWNGYVDSAAGVFRRMLLEGLEPDSATFLTLLTACNHGGSVSRGVECFQWMVGDHGLAPAVHHFLCFVDSLGRSGRLEEAEELIESMPFESQEITWTTLLGACKTHGDGVRGVYAARKFMEFDPHQSQTYKLLSASIYSS